MIVALLVLSIAMIVSGLLAMVLGWDIVLLERGWAMVIAGSVSTSGGAILLGLVAVISRLARIQSELGHLHEGRQQADLSLPPSPVIDPVSLLSTGLLAGGGSAETRSTEKAEPTLPRFKEAEHAAEAPELAAGADDGKNGDGRSTRLPSGAREDRFGAPRKPEPEPGPAVPEDMFADHADEKPSDEDDELPESAKPAWARGQESEPPKPDWARDKSDEARPEKPEPEPAEPSTPAPAARSPVIGTYNSGGNRYVMFADGSIEAETPDGVFKFASLDELKEFIASGGESSGPT